MTNIPGVPWKKGKACLIIMHDHVHGHHYLLLLFLFLSLFLFCRHGTTSKTVAS